MRSARESSFHSKGRYENMSRSPIQKAAILNFNEEEDKMRHFSLW